MVGVGKMVGAELFCCVILSLAALVTGDWVLWMIAGVLGLTVVATAVGWLR